MSKPYRKRTIKELQSEIRDLTKQVNTRVSTIKLTRTLPKDVQQAVNYMKQLGGAGRGKNEIGLHLRGKTKSELILQARELSAFMRWDIESEEGIRQLEAREQNEWDSFKINHPDWSYEEWRKFVEISGALGSDIMSKFGSETILSDFKKRKDVSGQDYIKVMRQALAEADGKTQTQLVDDLRDRLGRI